MTYEEAVRAFEQKFKFVVSDGVHTNSARDEWGVEYIPVYANQKNGKSGIPAAPICSSSPEEAIGAWLEAALDSVPGGMVTLYWRVMPVMYEHPGRGGVYAFSRMSFSANQPKTVPAEPLPTAVVEAAPEPTPEPTPEPVKAPAKKKKAAKAKTK